MATQAFTLPSLNAFLEANRNNHEVAVRAGMATIGGWPEQEAFLRQEHKAMSAMDGDQLEAYLKSRHNRDIQHWKQILAELDRLIETRRIQEAKNDGAQQGKRRPKRTRK